MGSFSIQTFFQENLKFLNLCALAAHPEIEKEEKINLNYGASIGLITIVLGQNMFQCL